MTLLIYIGSHNLNLIWFGKVTSMTLYLGKETLQSQAQWAKKKWSLADPQLFNFWSFGALHYCIWPLVKWLRISSLNLFTSLILKSEASIIAILIVTKSVLNYKHFSDKWKCIHQSNLHRYNLMYSPKYYIYIIP